MKTSIPGLVIRETRLNDLNSIYSLGLEEPVFTLLQNWNAPAIADVFCSEDLLAYTAARKKEIFGFIIGTTSGYSAEIKWILVNDRFRKRGIGSALINAFIQSSKPRGAEKFLVALLPENTETETFFIKNNLIQRTGFIRLSGKL